MIQNLNDNSTNRSIKVDKKDWAGNYSVQGDTAHLNYVYRIPGSFHFSDLKQIKAWIDRNKDQMTKEDFCRDLAQAIDQTITNGYNLEKK